MMPGRSVSSRKDSGEALRVSQTRAGSRARIAKILPPTLKTRLSHVRCAVAMGKERQNSRNAPTSMEKFLGEGDVRREGGPARKRVKRESYRGKREPPGPTARIVRESDPETGRGRGARF